jgi:hypothetical protein
MFEQYKYTLNYTCNYIYSFNYNVFFGNIISVLDNCLKFFKIERLAVSQICKFFLKEEDI